MFYNSNLGIQDCCVNLSKIDDSTKTDDYYFSKYHLRKFSIQLENLKEKDEPIVKTRPKIGPRPPPCNCGCGGTSNDDYYKKLFNVQDFHIPLSRLSASKTKRKFVYPNYYNNTEEFKRLKCRDFSSENTNHCLAEEYDIWNQDKIMFNGIEMKRPAIVLTNLEQVEREDIPETDNESFLKMVKDFHIHLSSTKEIRTIENKLIKERFAIKEFLIMLSRIEASCDRGIGNLSLIRLMKELKIKEFSVRLPKLSSVWFDVNVITENFLD